MKHDNWKDKATFCCETCMYFVEKNARVGRCRRANPTIKGFPAVFTSDWCGEHKLDADSLTLPKR